MTGHFTSTSQITDVHRRPHPVRQHADAAGVRVVVALGRMLPPGPVTFAHGLDSGPDARHWVSTSARLTIHFVLVLEEELSPRTKSVLQRSAAIHHTLENGLLVRLQIVGYSFMDTMQNDARL